MDSVLWKKFENGLKKQNTTFEEIKGNTKEDDIKEIINSCEITNIIEVSKVLTIFKSKQSNFKFLNFLQIKQKKNKYYRKTKTKDLISKQKILQVFLLN